MKSNDMACAFKDLISTAGKTDKSKCNFDSLFKCPPPGFYESSFIREMPNLDSAESSKQNSED